MVQKSNLTSKTANPTRIGSKKTKKIEARKWVFTESAINLRSFREKSKNPTWIVDVKGGKSYREKKLALVFSVYGDKGHELE